MPIPDSETVILITRSGMGQADPELQHKLIMPAVICFYTEGIHLAVTGSPVLESLRSLEAKGVRLILCSTCLNFYHLADQVQVGIPGGMTDIIEAQRRAGKVITI
jgi:hypothetical protein